MKKTLLYLTLLFLWVSLTKCNGDQKKTETPAPSNSSAKPVKHADSLLLKESFNQEDTIKKGSESDSLQSIRINFKRINSVSNWTKKETVPLSETSEGGDATFYYLKGQLEKIVTKNFGEMFQQLTEYYLLKGDLSFVFEKTLKYNRPIYYDSTVMKENKDTVSFDLSKSEIIESRNYFFNGNLIDQINSDNNASPVTGSHLKEEQQRIKSAFNDLVKLSTGR